MTDPRLHKAINNGLLQYDPPGEKGGGIEMDRPGRMTDEELRALRDRFLRQRRSHFISEGVIEELIEAFPALIDELLSLRERLGEGD